MKEKKYETILQGVDLSELSPEVRQKVWEHREREKCKAKHRYLTADSAEVRSNYYDNESKRTRHSKWKSRTYQCPWCHFFHLTTNPRRG